MVIANGLAGTLEAEADRVAAQLRLDTENDEKEEN